MLLLDAVLCAGRQCSAAQREAADAAAALPAAVVAVAPAAAEQGTVSEAPVDWAGHWRESSPSFLVGSCLNERYLYEEGLSLGRGCWTCLCAECALSLHRQRRLP